jgi:hypothetical protein
MESSFEKFAKERVDDLLEILAERNRNEINEFMSNVEEAYYKKDQESGWDRLKQAIRNPHQTPWDQLSSAEKMRRTAVTMASLNTRRDVKPDPHEINGKSVLPPQERWKPEVGETYWSPGLVGPVDWTWMKDSVDLSRYDCGMVLRTKEEAVDVMEQIKQLLTRKP